jgi:hypothetical protein
LGVEGGVVVCGGVGFLFGRQQQQQQQQRATSRLCCFVIIVRVFTAFIHVEISARNAHRQLISGERS